MTGIVRGGALLLAALTLAGCGGGGDGPVDAGESSSTSAPAPSETSEPTATPTPIESAECQESAGEVLDILELGLNDRDVRDLAGRLDTVDDLLPEAVARCSGAVSRPTNEAQEALSESFDAAMNGTKGGAKSYATAYEKVAEAKAALEAMSE